MILLIAGALAATAAGQPTHTPDPEVVSLSDRYRGCLVDRALSVDDGIQPVETIANVAEADCLMAWMNLAANVRRKAREIVLAAPGDRRVADQMIRSFDENLVRMKSLIRNQAIGQILEHRARHAVDH